MRRTIACCLALGALAACSGDICSQTASLYSQYASALQACQNQQLQALGQSPAPPAFCSYDTSSCESGLSFCSAQDI